MSAGSGLRLSGLALLAVLAGCTAKQQPNADPARVAAVAYRAPGPSTLTLYTMVNNRSGEGAHTSLMINASQRIIFDPAGSFRVDIVPERDDVLFGVTPSVEKAYRGSHARETFHVLVQEFEVTPEQAETAYQLALKSGPVAGAFCTSATSQLLQQVPGFGNIKSVMFPIKLSRQLAAMPGVKSTRYYEKDSADLKDGLERNNAILNQQVE